MMNRERKRCKTLTEFKLQTSAIILQINNQLAAGFINLQQNIPAYGIGTQESYTGDNVRFYTPLEQVIDLYEKDRCGELKETTMRSYSCFCKQFKQWVHNNCPSIAASVFSQTQANQYMEFVLLGNNSKGKKSVRMKIREDRVSPRIAIVLSLTSRKRTLHSSSSCNWCINPSCVR